jgi:hypothetical protein
MAEAGGLQSLYEDNVDRGFIVITALDGDATRDLARWADEYGLTHPVVGDADGEFFWTFSRYSAWPMVVLIDHGMVITSADEGADMRDVEDLLRQYE